VGAAIGAAMHAQIQQLGEGALPEGMLPGGADPAALLGQIEPMLERMSGSMFGLQVGQAVGALAAETVSGTEVGLPLVADRSVALLPANVEAFAEGLGIDLDQVRLYLAVREAARVRLFSQVPWLGPQLLSAVADYARNITIDTDAIESALTTVDPSDPEALRAALQGNLFTPSPTPAQRAALGRLETLLALAVGWVHHVAERTTARHLPQSAALGETVRRRRVGGAAQRTFAGLVGLELHPRRLRDAANLWAALEDAGGAALRDGRWAHPDLAPTAADLDDPIGFVDRATGRTGEDASHPQLGADLDSVLKSILDEAGASGADAAGGNPLGTAPSGTTGDAAGDTDSGGDDDPRARPGEDPGALPDDERQ
jgi:putative hydrolase